MGDIKYAPFIEKYTQIFTENDIEYEIIFWNRDADEKDVPVNCKAYRNHMKLDLPKRKKIKGFWGFRNFCKFCIKENGYDKLVILTTLSAFFVFDILLHKYRKKYLFDIRDFSYENIRLFKVIENRLIKNSEYTIISSPYFKEFLLKGHDYIVCHNHNKQDDLVEKVVKIRKESKINVGFVGALRYFEHQKYIIDALANDDRFLLSYYGTGPQLDRFKKYKADKNIKNMFLYGGFNNQNIGEILKQVDILNNSYGYADSRFSAEIHYAMSNKYYSGLQWAIPQLVETDSCKCKRVESLNLGIGIDIKDTEFADKLYQYYLTYDEDLLRKEAAAELKRINEEEKVFYSSVKEFIKDGKEDE